MATGVLIMGVGKGTKQLQGFLECTKTYEATVLFGAATDTYDVLGKVLRKGDYAFVTREKVENALGKFRGKIMQRPPIYSALRVQGKRLYEYAREGKEVPKEIEKRPVRVEELEIMEWMDGGKHDYQLPKEEADEEARDIAEKVLHLDEAVGTSIVEEESETRRSNATSSTKRKRPLEDEDDSVHSKRRPATAEGGEEDGILMSGGLQSPDRTTSNPTEPCSPESPLMDSHNLLQNTLSSQVKGPPAVKLRMTVTSGFYVRSLSHDLGEAIGSLACMSELVRTRQGDFELGKNVMEYEDLDKGEEVWGPKVESLLGECIDREGKVDRKESWSEGAESRRREDDD